MRYVAYAARDMGQKKNNLCSKCGMRHAAPEVPNLLKFSVDLLNFQ